MISPKPLEPEEDLQTRFYKLPKDELTDLHPADGEAVNTSSFNKEIK